MIPSFAYSVDSSWSYGPMFVYLFAMLTIGFLMIYRSQYRNWVAYSALLTAVTGFIYSVLVMLSYITDAFEKDKMVFGVSCVFYIFYGICTATAFIPGFIAFSRISQSKVSRNAVHFGYAWAVIIIIASLSLTIALGVILAKFNSDTSYQMESTLEHLNNLIGLLYFTYYSVWAFIPVTLALHIVNISHVAGKTRKSLIAHSVLNSMSVLFFTIFVNNQAYDSVIQAVQTIFFGLLFLSDIPIAAATVIAATYGHYWVSSSDATTNKVEVRSQQNIDPENNGAHNRALNSFQ